MISIRGFLSSVIVAILLLFNFVALVNGYSSGVQTTQALLDEHLQTTAGILSLSTNPKLASVQNLQAFEFQVIVGQRVIAHSEHMANAPIVALKEGFGWVNFNDARWRVFVHEAVGRERWVIVAEPKAQRDAVAEQVALSALSPILWGLPLVLLCLWVVVTVALKPLVQLSGGILHKNADDLSPLSIDPLPNELAPLLENTNALLARLKTAFDQEKYFIAEASHELRTPISTLKIHLHNLAPSMEGNEAFQAIKQQVNHMARLIDQLLDLSKNQAGHYRAAFESLNLRVMAEEECARLYSQLADKKLSIALNPGEATVNGHPLGLRTLFTNLLENAIKYTPVGGSVQVNIVQRDESVELSVEDSGPGMQTDVARATQRFFREGSSAQLVEGTGLGLAIVQSIVQQHQGRLSFHQASLGGLCVKVSLPVNKGVKGASS